MPTTPKRIRLLIADDDRLFREGLRLLLESRPVFQVVGHAANGAQAVKLARKVKPDVLLLDLAMPGLETLRAISGDSAPTRTIVLAGSIARDQAVAALQLGACGIVLKNVAPETLFKSINAVVQGQYWIDRGALAEVIAAYREMRLPDAKAVALRPYNLTPRELEIIEAVAAGRSNKEIAQALKVSEYTVKHHLTSIFDKVGSSSRLELALFAMHNDLV